MDSDHSPETTKTEDAVTGDEPNQQINPEEQSRESSSSVTESNLANALENIPQLIDRETVTKMINLQVAAIDRLETTNKSLTNCNTMAQNKLASTTKLFKKASKQISDSKKDLDIIYKKIVDLKAKIKQDRPDLFPSNPANTQTEIVTETNAETDPNQTIEKQ